MRRHHKHVEQPQVDLAKWAERSRQMYADDRERIEWIETRLNRCESELERFFVCVIAVCCCKMDMSFAGESYPGDNSLIPAPMDVRQQVKIGDYRCDFLFTLTYSGESRAVAVECDGHSFHERTPEQASADRRRDRHLLARGVPTLRYTYHDITTDPTAALTDLIGTMRALMPRKGGSQ